MVDDRDFDLLTAEIVLLHEYVDLLTGALESTAVYLDVHGWKWDPAKVRRGRELREALGIEDA